MKNRTDPELLKWICSAIKSHFWITINIPLKLTDCLCFLWCFSFPCGWHGQMFVIVSFLKYLPLRVSDLPVTLWTYGTGCSELKNDWCGLPPWSRGHKSCLEVTSHVSELVFSLLTVIRATKPKYYLEHLITFIILRTTFLLHALKSRGSCALSYNNHWTHFHEIWSGYLFILRRCIQIYLVTGETPSSGQCQLCTSDISGAESKFSSIQYGMYHSTYQSLWLPQLLCCHSTQN